MPASSPPASLPDRYRVTRRIASGGMATVFAAEDTVLGRLVAVKVLAEHYASDAGARERFEREARAAARVSDHPHVATIYDIGEHEDTPFIVMEHFAGGTLADRLRSGDPIPRPTAVMWLEDAATALDHAHRHGIVHRDVKPGNLLIDEHGRLAVADFGIARMASEERGQLTETGQVMGTAAYLSPEQAAGRPATAASDRYALAVVAFELLTGQRPFPGEHMAAQARAHIERDPPAPSEAADDLPGAVDRVLLRGLAKNPERRWPTSRSMVRALDDALGDGTAPDRTAATRAMFAAQAPPAPRTPRPRTPTPRPRVSSPRTPVPRTPAPRDRDRGRPPAAGEPRRHGWAVALAAIAVVALLVGGGAALLTGGDDGDGTSGERAAERRANDGSGNGRGNGRASREERSAASRDEAPAAPVAPADEEPAPDAAAQPEQAQKPQRTQEPAPTDGRSSAELQATGHEALLAGDYDTAIQNLQAAIQGCPVSTTDPCAYAYYDLGVAYTEAGRPQEAIPILETRLQNPDQQATVQAALDEARAAAGEAGAEAD